MNKNKTLLEHYGIPLHHLDFEYVGKCTDARELEKIIRILRSGEEGYYPHLTGCAEEKLRELCPNSHLLRVEEKLYDRYALANNEFKPIYDWNQEIKNQDSTLQQFTEQPPPLEEGNGNNNLTPIREANSIYLDKFNNETFECKKSSNRSNNAGVRQARIASTDYSKWDKYDPDEEILRMDLADERRKEEIDRRKRITIQKSETATTSMKQSSINLAEESKLKQFYDFEKEKLCEGYRLRGNEYFRAKEYKNALREYTKAINICPQKALVLYKNRALTYYKMERYFDSIMDSEECLKLEPNDVKARLLLADATYAYGCKGKSYNLYMDVLDIDPNNAIAIKATTKMRQLNITPPANATRIQIEDNSGVKDTSAVKPIPIATLKPSAEQKPQGEDKVSDTQKTTDSNAKALKRKSVEYDLAELVKPNRIVKNKFISAAEKLSKMHSNSNLCGSSQKIPMDGELSKLQLPTNCNKQNKVLIEEL